MSSFCKDAICPVKPPIELSKINSADIPEMFFKDVQLSIIKIGVKKIPPPTPIIPEKKPINKPITNASLKLYGFSGFSSFFLRNLDKSKIPETIKNAPANILNRKGSSFMNPPKNEAGNDEIINARNIFLSKYPLEINLIEVMRATIIFKISDVGLMLSGEKESKAITAKYPEAPACPTDE